MADPYAPVALQIQTPDTFRRIGEMINFARGATALQRERATMEADIAQRQAESERAGIETGVARQTAGPRVEQQRASTATAQTQATSAQWKLDAEQATKAYEIAAGVSQDPAVVRGDSAGSVTALMRAEEQMRALKIPEDKIRVQMAPLYALAGHKPQDLRQTLDNIVRSQSGTQAQAAVINAPVQPVGTGADIRTFQSQPGAPGGAGFVQPNTGPRATIVPVSVPPAEAEQRTTDALGRPVIQRKAANGAISFAPPPGSDYKPMMTLPAGETPETAKPLLALRDNAQAAAAGVPAMRFNNRKILELADDAFTGTGSRKMADIFNAVGLKNFVPGDAAANTSQLAHFIGLQVVQNAAAQGANTDAARQLAEQSVLPGSSPAQAIKAITKVNDAYATGTELFNRGMQATLKNPANTKDIFAIRDFQNQWTRNMDPRIFMLENAVKDGDKAEVERIKKSLGPDGVKQLLQKAQNLRSLITSGQVGGS